MTGVQTCALPISGGMLFGAVNNIVWNPGGTAVSIYITNGFTLTGTEVVTPASAVTDIAGNPLANTFQLTVIDTMAPQVASVSASIPNPVPANSNFQLTTVFSSSLNNTIEPVIEIISSDTTGTIVVPTGGTWSSTNTTDDTYTTQVILIGADKKGAWQVNVSVATDSYGNVMLAENNVYEFNMQAAAPTIINYPVAPTVTPLTTNTVMLQGTRDPNTAIWINGSEMVSLGTGDWVANLNLVQGANVFVILAKDAAGFDSASVEVPFFVDSIAPVISTIQPANNSFIKLPPTISIDFVEAGSGLDIPGSTLQVTRDGLAVSGNWTSTGTTLVFTPSIQLLEGSYQIAVILVDNHGLASVQTASQFTLDQTPPAAPTINSHPAVTSIITQTFGGTKEAYAAIWFKGQQVVDNTATTTWSYTATLVNGENILAFTARDQAGNESVPASTTISFDNSAPGQVAVNGDGQGDGTKVILDWTGYNEIANGNDIKSYSIYQSATIFADVSLLVPIATVPAGIKTYTATGLTRNQLYFFAVVATDTLNNALTTATSISVIAQDVNSPEDATNLAIQSFDNRLMINWTHSVNTARSEERRVGKECRSRWSPYH